MTVSAIRPVDIQSHLYSSFLHGHTADVVLRVSGRWKAFYRLHRVVLIQADFFRSLFTSGFRESDSQLRPRQGGVEEVDIVFDDSNITRAAFEICISRLYGGGPPLHVFSCLVPSTAQPLSPSLGNPLEAEVVPEGHHPASPRLLLSVLATSIYLCIPTVASHALSLIFKTLGPLTVMPYLNFALGKSIDTSIPLYRDPEAGAGLERVAELIDDDSASTTTEGFAYIPRTQSSQSSASSDDTSDSEAGDNAFSSHNYGPISDKIGEACACWLTRWARDMLDLEMGEGKYISVIDCRLDDDARLPRKPLIWGRGGLDADWVTAIVAADTLFVKSEKERYDFARSVVEFRRRDGIDGEEEEEWAKLFDEAIYYENMAMDDIIAISHDKSPITERSFVPIATLQGALWSQSLLRHHITAKPSSPKASLSFSQSAAAPAAKERELGLAFSSNELGLPGDRNELQLGSPSQNFCYPVPGDSSWKMGDNGEEASDPSARIQVSMDELFTFSHSAYTASARQSSNAHRAGTRKVATDKDTEICSTESTFFGLKRERCTTRDCASQDPKGKRRWTSFPPCRFGVEFWNIDALKEKSRLHSQTVWYAGSLFNVYLQVVKKKGQTQLGIYLYRQSSVEAIPPASAPFPLATSFGRSGNSEEGSDIPSSSPRSERPQLSRGISNASFQPSTSPSSPRSVPVSSPTLTSRTLLLTSSISPPTPPIMMPAVASSTPPTSTTSSSSNITVPYTSSPVAPQQPYRDPRASISAYFMISCASATGPSQMRFTSAPDLFSVGQSWGWKTSSLRTDQYMEVGDNVTAVENRTAANSLRATVVLGLI